MLQAQPQNKRGDNFHNQLHRPAMHTKEQRCIQPQNSPQWQIQLLLQPENCS